VRQIVVRLERVVARPSAPLAGAERQRQSPGRVVRAADIAHFTSAHQVGQRLDRLFDRRLGIVGVSLVEVDIIGLKPAETIVTGTDEVRPAQPFASPVF
jgi:hypothetical protein